MAKEFKLTAARVKELEEELNYLKTTRMQEVVEDIKEARPRATCLKTVNTTRPEMSRQSCLAVSRKLRISLPMR